MDHLGLNGTHFFGGEGVPNNANLWYILRDYPEKNSALFGLTERICTDGNVKCQQKLFKVPFSSLRSCMGFDSMSFFTLRQFQQTPGTYPRYLKFNMKGF